MTAQPGRGASFAVRAVLVRLGLILVGSVVAVAAATGPAAAHNVLRSTSPETGSTVDRVPGTVVLTFDNPAIAMGTQLVITGPSGEVQQGPPRLVDNTVAQDLQGGAPAGTYTVLWRVTSIDGHPVGGTFTFTARDAGLGTPAPTPNDPGSAAGDSTGRANGGGASGQSSIIWVMAGTGVAGVAVLGWVLVRRRRRDGADDDQGQLDTPVRGGHGGGKG